MNARQLVEVPIHIARMNDRFHGYASERRQGAVLRTTGPLLGRDRDLAGVITV